MLRQLFEQPDDNGKTPSSKEVDDNVVGFTNGALFHELGHGLISLYNLPTTGKEEDAVDQLSVFLLSSSDEKHRNYIVDSINAYGALATLEEANEDATDRLGQYADEHSLSSQRFYNWACWLYGSDTKAYASVVESDDNPDGVLPPERAERCKGEFDQLSHSWSTLLKPYLK